MSIIFSNDAFSTLAGAITNVATTANLAPGSGILFPNPSTGQYFVMSFYDAPTRLLTEIVHVTVISGDTVTLVRGQEGTTPLAWNAGDFAEHVLTAGQMSAFLQSVSGPGSTRIVTLSGAYTMTNTDYAIGLNRTTSLATSNTTLPGDAVIGQEFYIEDLVGNFQAFPLTVNAPGGMTISNLSSIVLNVNHQSGHFRYYGSNVWGVGGVY